MISVLDYGVGNWGAIINMFKKIGAPAQAIRSPEEVLRAEKIILPGVGAFDAGISKLRESGLAEALEQRVIVEKIPCLGICLGMQLMTKGSEEGSLSGLGWIKANTVRFKLEKKIDLRVPHMGWNYVGVQKESTLFPDTNETNRFYFVHSFHLDCEDRADVLATCSHGYDFVAAIQHEHIMGVQFHPEKSHKFGMKLLANFAKN